MSYLYFNDESDYSEENTCDNEFFRSTTLQFICQFIIYSIRIGNLHWCKYEHCKNEAREIDCLCCREVIVLA